ncbi:hypothetical protein ACO0LB_13435 [Undibacterium sp. SXout7W]|uniref:hypothetical protein n=1 Tax=Undibacterium sp. SXout7W TaxID=3413049 RepID=UPI003BF2731D
MKNTLQEASGKVLPLIQKYTSEVGIEVTPSIFWRILAIAMSLVFFNVYSRLIFVIFMGNQGFFSYDLFSDGILGMEIFFGTVEIMMIILSIAFFGLLLPVFQWLFKKEVSWAAVVFFLAAGGLMWSLGIAAAQSPASKFNSVDYLAITGIFLFITLYFATAMYAPAKKSIRTLLALQAVILCMSAVTPETVVKVLKPGLKMYSVGGDLPIEIMGRNGDLNKGELVFLSPINLYMRLEKEGPLLILKRDECKIQIFIQKQKKIISKSHYWKRKILEL